LTVQWSRICQSIYERSYSSASAVANNPDVDDAFSIADSPGSFNYLRTDKQQDLEDLGTLWILTLTALI